MQHDIVIIKCWISFKDPNIGSPKVPADNVLPGDGIKYDAQVSVKKRIFSMSVQVIALPLLYRVLEVLSFAFVCFYLLETLAISSSSMVIFPVLEKHPPLTAEQHNLPQRGIKTLIHYHSQYTLLSALCWEMSLKCLTSVQWKLQKEVVAVVLHTQHANKQKHTVLTFSHLCFILCFIL